MSESASIYNPVDSTLQARIHAFKQVLRASRDIKQASKNINDSAGTPEEVKEASKVINDSLKKALKISNEELATAKAQGLLTTQEVKEINIEQKKLELANFRNDSASHEHKKDGKSFSK